MPTRLTSGLVIDHLRFRIRNERLLRERLREMTEDVKNNKPRNLLRLAGVINAANREADDEAGALIARVRKNQRRTLGLIAKGHHNESLREQMLSETEKEQALSDLAAAVGDNGAPFEDEEEDKIREELKAAKSPSTSKSSEQSPPAVGEQSTTFQQS